MRVYCISGLGADHRAFQRLNIPDHELVHVPWIAPNLGEPLAAYARRLAETIDTEQAFTLLGLSFGGMVAAEMSVLLKPSQLILISSIPTPEELPLRYRIADILKLPSWMPSSLLCKPSRFAHWLFGAKTEEAKALFNDMLASSEVDFMRWAIGAVLSWKEEHGIAAIRIHGTKDRILPPPNPCHLIPDAGHLAIYTHHAATSKILAQVLC